MDQQFDEVWCNFGVVTGCFTYSWSICIKNGTASATSTVPWLDVQSCQVIYIIAIVVMMLWGKDCHAPVWRLHQTPKNVLTKTRAICLKAAALMQFDDVRGDSQRPPDRNDPWNVSVEPVSSIPVARTVLWHQKIPKRSAMCFQVLALHQEPETIRLCSCKTMA